jgi:hypothetical protein
MRMAKKIRELEITELILVKTGSNWGRTFMGTIKRETDENGNANCRGEVIAEEGKIWSVGQTEKKLGDNLDMICEMKLNMGLHTYSGVTTIICETESNLN